MTGIAKLFRYTRYVEQQRDSSTEELNQVYEAWNNKSLLAKMLNYYTSVFTGEDAELKAKVAKTILREREASKSGLVQTL